MSERLTYTVPEVAELLGIARSTAYDCIRRGEIPALTLGRRVVSRAALSELLDGCGGKRVPNGLQRSTPAAAASESP